MNIEQMENLLQEYFNSGDYGQAETWLDDTARNAGNEPLAARAWHHLGRIRYYGKEYAGARACFLQSLNEPYSLLYLALCDYQQGQAVSAMKTLALFCRKNIKEHAQTIQLFSDFTRSMKYDAAMDNLMPEGDSKPAAAQPLVSIIILCYNKLHYTRKCLQALLEKVEDENCEILVVDNASVDDTPAFLESFGSRIKLIRSRSNLGYVGGNNLGAEAAKGEFLLFLNNDTEVKPGWLPGLRNVFDVHPRAGAAGSMLIYPDGRLQEAGGIIFQDASGWNYGRRDDPLNAKYNFTREVDYCSGASLMVRASLFQEHGGFDTRFAPAYYEDTDLCFGIRRLGRQVFYCHSSQVVHHEGITAGTDLQSGFKKYQVINGPKFIEKWKNELAGQHPCQPEKVFDFSNRHRGKRILVIDDIPPLPDRAAGALRHYHTLRQMLNLGFRVTWVHLMGTPYQDIAARRRLEEFKLQGVEFIWFNYESWWADREKPSVKTVLEGLINTLELDLRKVDLIYIAFWHIAGYFIDIIRQKVPDCPVLVDTMDLHYLREIREAEIKNQPELKEKAKITKRRELEVYRKADLITTVTEADRQVLKTELPHKAVFILTDVHDPVDLPMPFPQREGFLFVANFNHNPNEDAVLYFVERIWPAVSRRMPDARFYVVGNNPTPAIKALASDRVVVTGWVPEIRPYLEKCRVSVVPLRYGAGNKGKVGESLSHGLPMVSTTIGAEGMNIINGVHAFVADDPDEFAACAVRLYTEQSTWESFAVRGKELITGQYSSELMRRRLSFITSFESRADFRSERASLSSSPPLLSIIFPTGAARTGYIKELTALQNSAAGYSHEIMLAHPRAGGRDWRTGQNLPGVRFLEWPPGEPAAAAVNSALKTALGQLIWIHPGGEIPLLEGFAAQAGSQAENPRPSITGLLEGSDNAGASRDSRLPAGILINRRLLDLAGGLDERFAGLPAALADYWWRAVQSGAVTSIIFTGAAGIAVADDASSGGSGAVPGEDPGDARAFQAKWGVPLTAGGPRGRVLRRRKPLYPLYESKVKEHFNRAQILIAEQDLEAALPELKRCMFHFGGRLVDETGIRREDVEKILLKLQDLREKMGKPAGRPGASAAASHS